jgi:dTDP-4-amino-4,6-dideoxygalactose transaminase
MIKFLDLKSQYLSIQEEMDAAMQAIILNSRFIGGEAVAGFEDNFKAFQQAGYCIGVANGTDALEIAIEALNLPAGSEIIVPANSFFATSEAVTRAGHKVVFADASLGDYTLDPGSVERHITDQTAAIVVVHLYGHPCDMVALMELAQKHGLKVVEDCAQAHGAEILGKRIGALGDIGCFSFYPGKNLGAYGDGGAIVTNDEGLAIKSRMIANHGRIDKYNHRFEGRNSRLDGLQAAVLDVKLRHLAGWLEQRRRIAAVYLDTITTSQVVLPVVSNAVTHAYHLFVIRTQDRDGLKAHLNGQGIQTGIHYPIALPKLEAYRAHPQFNVDFGVCAVDETLLSLPIGEHLSEADAATVAQAVNAYFA